MVKYPVIKSPVVKSPELDKRERFGSSSSGETPAARRVAATPKDTIAKFSVVMLQHKGTPFRVRVTKVLPPDRFEGHVLGALPPALEIEDLEPGCVVGFGLDDVWGVER
jgi:hypothetical protein